jgi:hypothetical protein
LTADALLMYGVDVRHITKLADWCPGLLKVVKQKLRGDDADRAKNIVAQHNRRMDETLSEEFRNGQYFLCVIVILIKIFRFPTVMGSDRSWKMMSRVQLSGVNKTLLVNYKMGLTNYTTQELLQFWECTTRICRLLMLSGVTC